MRTLLITTLLVTGIVTARAEQPRLHGNLAAAKSIAKADTDFAALAKRIGTAKAFRDNMDDVDGVVYGGGSKPAIGRAAIYAEMGGDVPGKSVLAWHPREVFAAAAGDMGVSRGRWTSTPKAGGATIGGAYVTVWRKDANRHWKDLIDIGNADPKR